MSKLNSLELFSGAGGLALGLESSGWAHRVLVERNADACSTLLLNKSAGHPLAKGWNLFSGDVREFDYAPLGIGAIDLIAGGPPCQPFSLGGKHKADKDHRDMFPEAVRAVRTLRPRFFVFENVKGLLRQSFATYFNYIVLQLTYPEVARMQDESWQSHLGRLERTHTSGKTSGLHYRVVYRLLNASEYGVPQNRHRVFIVGFRSDLGQEWSFPVPSHSHDRLLWDQWVDGSYWDEHKVPKRDRPQLLPRTRARVEKLAA
ncbi:MAG TPA: DNA cytosine methyltransferase, partial [Phycisphaerae bacterium]|nr:DNA cytosine methyltransferase [Phycisphaerae bacterium]